ncbi:MAG: type I methionyl aminopeptidase [Vampirovibrionia bacterium]
MITKKSKHEINLMRTAGSIVAEALAALKEMAKPGVTTLELDETAEKIIRSHNAIPTFKGYMGFPGSICASVNEAVVHGIPSNDIVLKEGDIISIDCGATYKGLVGDSAITVPIGSVSDDIILLLKATEEALYAGIEASVVDANLQAVSGAIEDVAIKHGLGIVRNYGGHGVGRNMHEEPFIHNWRTGDAGPKLKRGMTYCLEPMFNLGGDDVHTLSDEWTVVTSDAKPSAHFEHAIAITDDGPLILTKL